ncbi:phosphoribosylamine--glycine ligase [Helicobacter ibis]|uniref:Phosphoribosylamine--glycine ligase n=1 Tax=Helicobacter ibis TaxID=2962633 RepID=A0ABT4VH42_9HELI|nr:phosphoribosylamine--glycine ligase [Helicobacter ibis]MDA3969356.1 phosphoribosylamine--glycine ligase [Helicobacter ibis]
MKIVIVGSGGREYSIGLALSSESKVSKIYFYPGNGATCEIGENLDCKNDDEFVSFVIDNDISLVIVGPESPLVDGLADRLRENNILVFGPSKNAARLEASKAFMKEFAKRHNIPTARFLRTSSYDDGCNFIDSLQEPIVVKADGLCAGKGVIIAQSKDEAKSALKDMLDGSSFGDSGRLVVIEEFLDGFELSVFAMCDGEGYIVLPAAQDHKRLLNNDKGPNTGGMGAYAPSPLASSDIIKKVEQNIIIPTLNGMKNEGNPFSGALFCGIMVVNGEPYLLEFNVRFGDPECEVLMPLFESGLLDCFLGCAKGDVRSVKYALREGVCVGVVLASKDYPYKSSKETEISIAKNDNKNTFISFAGVRNDNGKLLASGGRVLVCVGYGQDVLSARNNAYNLVEKIEFSGKQYRNDIAYQAL